MAVGLETVAISAAPGFSSATIAISLVFLAFLPSQLYKLYRSRPKVHPSWHGRSKLAVDEKGPSPAALWFSLIAASALCWLIAVAHIRSVEPSSLALLYLLASTGCDILWALAPRSRSSDDPETALSTALFWLQIPVKLTLLVLESHSKEAILLAKHKHLSPEDTAGLVQRVLFWWVNPILARGSRQILQNEDLPRIGQQFSSDGLRRAILRAWHQRSITTLPLVLVRCLQRPFRAAIVPRLCLVIFRFAQPVLIQQSIRFVSQSHDEEEVGVRVRGYWILVAAFFVYTGLAFSTVLYQRALARLRVMTRGALVSLIYATLLNASSDVYDTGKAVTLMSTDVDSLDDTSEMFHELWGHMLEVLVGMTVLYGEVGWLCTVPPILIFFCSRVSKYVAQNLKSRQKNWTLATQDRIATTANMLSFMKSIKILGLSEAVANLVRDSRLFEMGQAKKIRWMMIFYNASANALGIFTPAITIILYAVLAKVQYTTPLDPETAFTTIAILSMVTHPANMVMTIVPRAIACLASFERIQSYLIKSTRHDPRTSLEDTTRSPGGRLPAVRLRGVTVGIKQGEIPILQDINVELHAGQVAVCSGPVGSGKSVLARTILGEVPLSEGAIQISTQNIGLCSQAAWLPDGTIKQAICGPTNLIDVVRYAEAVRVCCLDYDILTLPDGDSTGIGSRGINLSGGQKQRLALARLVYARCSVVILDDPFSALDGKTEMQVIENLLGPQGIFRREGTTVLWISNSAQYFTLADHVILMDRFKIITQGPWIQVQSQVKYELTLAQKTTGDSAKAPEAAGVAVGLQKLQGQERAAHDIALDIKRKAGDLSLYGFYISHTGVINFFCMIASTMSSSFFVTFPNYWLKWWTEAPPSTSAFYIIGYVLLVLMAWISANGIMMSTMLLVAVYSGLNLHELLLATVVKAPLSYFSLTESGTLLNRFSQDIQLVDKDLPNAAQALSVQIFKLVVQMALLLTVQRLMLLALPFCLLVVYVVQRFYLMTSRQLRLLDLESRSAVFSSFLETVEGLTTLRAFGWQRLAEQHSLNALDSSQRAFYLVLCLQRWLNLVLNLTIAGIAITTIALAINFKGSRDGASIGVALNVVLVANTTLLRLVESFTSVEISLGGIARLKGMQENTPVEDKQDEEVIPGSDWPSSGSIQLRGVSASYDATHKALDEVFLKIKPGSKVAICGRTGSGKSTLILAFLHLVEYSGSINVDGLDISKVPRSLVRQRCFISIPQDPFLMPHATLRLNLDETGVVPNAVLAASLSTVRLWDHLSSRNLDDDQDQNGILDRKLSVLPVLSAGQTQLLALARALVKRWILCLDAHGGTRVKPPLLLDEATASLDPVTEGIVHDVIDEEFSWRGHTVVMVTHRPSMLAGRMREGRDLLVFMKDGRVESVQSAGGGIGLEELRDLDED
ncbi:putative ABC transporter [Cryphonectria parasitica EP155]|uniref:ABC transporter n=1 Tax=Cryphonectria parasitica (strain ATCC 38755 / EP155) TaxID=660469 RepID=A0A9P4Y9R0_CRYP1|nr:putative ABC transporter [Cryphonectria parasitica EP155]KAF3769045.1 putative ABC transporter [Cryphonectria parasitica EP155]